MLDNQGLAQEIMNKSEILLKTSEELSLFMKRADFQSSSGAVEGMGAMLTDLIKMSSTLIKENPELNLPKALLSIQKSLILLWDDYRRGNDPSKSIRKIEYELIPLIQEMRAEFYFWACVYPDREKMDRYYKEEINQWYRNAYLESAEKTGEYPYEVSIVVVGYNKLDYTRACVESLLKFVPPDLNYELILLNHGSSDGTKEYFESVKPHKQLDVAVNGGGSDAVYRISEGKYSLYISNDVLITPNAIENMLCCMRSDENIAWVVPATSVVSNAQILPLQYETAPQLWNAARENNQKDPFRWEQRVRLCNPIDLRRNKAFFETQAATYPFLRNASAFPDDRISLLLRRGGYKLMLVKDAYCHHTGSVTLGEELQEQKGEEVYLKNRQLFYDAFQIDPWDKGFCYNSALFGILPCEKSGPVRILGINAGMGSNPLKIKEALKENVHNTDCRLYNYTMESKYLKDLKGISDEVRTLSSWAEFEGCNQGLDFDYILIEDHLENQIDVQERIAIVQQALKQDGYLVIRLTTRELAEWIEQERSAVTVSAVDFFACESTGYWAVIKG